MKRDCESVLDKIQKSDIITFISDDLINNSDTIIKKLPMRQRIADSRNISN